MGESELLRVADALERMAAHVEKSPALPHKCPVCEGRGTVPAGFHGNYGALGLRCSPEQCRACNGTGVLWSPGPVSL